MSAPRVGTRWLMGVCVLVAAVLLARQVYEGGRRPAEAAEPIPVKPSPPPPSQVAGPHLEWAEKECERAIEEHLKEIDRLFDDCKKGIHAFAGEALGWKSKGLIVVDVLPFTRTDRQEAFLREKFAECVMKPEQVSQAVAQVFSGYLADVRSIEGRMLVRLRADVANFPDSYPNLTVSDSQLRQSFDEAIRRAANATGSRLGEEVTKEVVVALATRVLMQVAVRLGVEAGILGAGAASSPYTLGAGFIVAVVLDYLWDWYSDPEGRLAADIDNKLDEIKGLVVDGDKDVKGLRRELREMSKEQAGLREKAVYSLFQGQH